jgi:hypothetical protein
MNWETYKLLTKEQKEEYNFRFNKDITFNIKGMTMTVMFLFTLFMMFLFISFIIVTSPQMEKFKDMVFQYISLAGQIFFVIGCMMLFYALEFLVQIAWRQYQYSKWKKKNNIKVVTWWKKFWENRRG